MLKERAAIWFFDANNISHAQHGASAARHIIDNDDALEGSYSNRSTSQGDHTDIGAGKGGHL